MKWNPRRDWLLAVALTGLMPLIVGIVSAIVQPGNIYARLSVVFGIASTIFAVVRGPRSTVEPSIDTSVGQSIQSRWRWFSSTLTLIPMFLLPAVLVPKETWELRFAVGLDAVLLGAYVEVAVRHLRKARRAETPA